MKKNYRGFQKRLLPVFLAMVLAIALFPVVTMASESDFIFDESSGSILKYIGTETEVVIPETIGGVPVQVIGREAFMNCSAVTSIVVPEGVTSIRGWAFGNCDSLEKITLPTSLRGVSDFSFKECGRLSDVFFVGEELSLLEQIDFGRENDSFLAASWFLNGDPYLKNTPCFEIFYHEDKTISVLVSIQSTGTIAISGELFFDPNVLELESVIGLDFFPTFIGPFSIESAMETGSFEYAAEFSTSPVNLSGTLPVFLAVFRPKADTVTSVRSTVSSCVDKDLNDIPCSGSEWSFSTTGEIRRLCFWGDVDGDYRVNTKDKVLVSRYLAKWTMAGSFHKAAADFNKDGNVTSAEAVVLARHLAKWTGLPYPVGKRYTPA